MKLLIDAELYLFTYCEACTYEAEWEPDDWTLLVRHGEVKMKLQSEINDLLQFFPGAQPVLCFGDRASFRYGVWPDYKSARKKRRKPAGYLDLVAWVEAVAPTRDWRFARFPDIEGDDVMGILYEPGDVICSWDKDLLSIPGTHWRNSEGRFHGRLLEANQEDADRQFFTQVLTGDATDGYPGCRGIGPKGAEKMLARCVDEAAMWLAVLCAFSDAGHSEEFLLQQARCARILRAGEYDFDKGVPRLWLPPDKR